MTVIRPLLCALLLLPGLARAQDAETLADIRQELSILYVEIQKLNRELSTTGNMGLNLSGTSVLERVDAMEAELQRLTADTEEMQFRIDRVVRDGTNRVGDLEFRLCELEPDCDISTLGDTPTLGGDTGTPPPAASAPAPQSNGAAELAIGEQQDFDRAKAALDSGEYRSASDLFAAFAETYTGGPLTGEAHYLRGTALSELGETAAAARAYLESFSGSPDGTRAPDALLQLGLELDALGQREDACATLYEVTGRFPESPAADEAQSARADLACG
ncbi:tol-pal system protein YbgF [Palleronia aestuarii]|uniref:Cell division coordinator CpoB n=1 Tax=Palleronia aestuarii TaxID=568105 RepID=A0A2W7P2L4_9RHOB|nr:tol-pal system protein YbgF [Palleronia aestuarii]PZX19666.1 tol-pal system protein YbgF [Palleronia aestuarii]